MIRYMIFGAVSLACVQSTQAAVVNLTGMHQQFVTKACASNADPCIIDFAKILAGKQIVIRRLFCHGNLNNFVFETATSTGVITGRTPINNTGGSDSLGELMHIADSTHVMRVKASNPSPTLVAASCMLVGEFLK